MSVTNCVFWGKSTQRMGGSDAILLKKGRYKHRLKNNSNTKNLYKDERDYAYQWTIRYAYAGL